MSDSMYEKLKDNAYFPYFDVKKKHDMKDLSREECMQIFAKMNEERKPFMHRYENPFMNIPSYADKFFGMFSEEDDIVVQEKIDGSNSHIHVTKDGVTCYGNNYILNEKNHLQGFWYWCNDHFGQVPEQFYDLDIYGEWLVPHHCEYPAERYGEFYVFDVMEDGCYWTQDRVKQLAEICGFAYAPVFYEGKFQSWKHLMTFVGKTALGGKKGEGIVVKNQSQLNADTQQFYIKIVDVEFQETRHAHGKIKTVNVDRVEKKKNYMDLTASIVTEARVRKILFKLVEDGELPSDWKKLEDDDLLKRVRGAVIKDCMKEEKETVDKIGNAFGYFCGEQIIKIARTIE